MGKFKKKYSADDRKKWQDEIKEERLDSLRKAVEEFSSSEKFKEFLDYIGSFRTYSISNQIIIFSHGGTLVAGYEAWKKKGRQVKKGEKAIRIYAPIGGKKYEEKKKDKNGDVITDENGNEMTETKYAPISGFRAVSVFDVTQTEGDPIPEPPSPKILDEDVSDAEFNQFFESIKVASPVAIEFEDISGGANGYYHNVDKRIAIKKGMPHAQTLKTAIHEMAHAILHNKEEMQKNKKNPQTKEIEAEGTAYMVCSYFGLSTEDYSFPYVASWSCGNVDVVVKALETIRVASDQIIDAIEKEMRPETAA